MTPSSPELSDSGLVGADKTREAEPQSDEDDRRLAARGMHAGDDAITLGLLIERRNLCKVTSDSQDHLANRLHGLTNADIASTPDFGVLFVSGV
jgi:hypothetical protein